MDVTARKSAITGEDEVDGREDTNALYERYWPDLVRLGHLLTGCRESGEDLAQEAFAGLLRAHAVDSPAAYLRRSLVNLAINHGRRAQRERAHLRTLREQAVDPVEPDDLWPLVRRLPAQQRAVLVLRYYLDFSEAEIARTLGCRPGTVKSHASKALARLRRELR